MTEIRKKGDPVLGARLRKIREDADLSQEELALRLGVKRAQISRIEGGSRGTGAATIGRWYRACGYELESIKVGTSNQTETLAMAAADLPEGELDSVIEIVAAWPRLNERQRGRILGIIETDEA
jgi:transcriptional regulator with XRE-family HTH domain